MEGGGGGHLCVSKCVCVCVCVTACSLWQRVSVPRVRVVVKCFEHRVECEF